MQDLQKSRTCVRHGIYQKYHQLIIFLDYFSPPKTPELSVCHRSVTATFTALLRRLTHPGTSVELRGSPLIHSIPSSGDLRNPATRFAPSIILSEESRWSSTGGHPISGAMFHTLPPARGFRPHGVASWAILRTLIGSRTQRFH